MTSHSRLSLSSCRRTRARRRRQRDRPPRGKPRRGRTTSASPISSSTTSRRPPPFREALTADSALAIARLNLGIALLYGGDAKKRGRRSKRRARRSPIGRSADYFSASSRDPRTAWTTPSRRSRGCARSIPPIPARRPTSGRSPCSSATTRGHRGLPRRRRGRALQRHRRLRAGHRADAQQRPRRAHGHGSFQALRATNYAVTYSQAYLEQGRYAEAIASTGAEAGLVDPRRRTSASPTSPARRSRAPPAPDRPTYGAVALADLDGDGDLDLIDGGVTSARAPQ